MTGKHIFLCGLLVVVAFVLSIQGFPLPWQDEIHILEMGRSTLDGITHPSAFAIGDSGRNFMPFYFIGPCIQEMAYRLLGFIGPRLSSLVGLILAAFFCGHWMSRRSLWIETAVFASLLMMLAALPMQSVRLVRVDSWAFSILFLALCVFGSRRRKRSLQGGLVCGFLCGLNVFVWPSAVLFGPFVLWALLDVWRKEDTPRARILGDIAVCILGSILAVLVCLLLSPNSIESTLAQYYRVNDVHAHSTFSVMAVLTSCCVSWAKEVLRDPLFFAWVTLGALVAFRRRQFMFLALVALTFVMMIPSGLHTYRLIYLWPFLIVFASETYTILVHRMSRRVQTCAIGTVMLMFTTNVLAYAVAAQLNPRPTDSTIRTRLADVVGRGPSNVVYSLSFQPYFAARALDWTYLRYADNTHIYDAKMRRELLERVNVVLIPHEPTFYAVEESFTPFGFLRNAAIDAARRESETKSPSRLGSIGAALAFRCNPPEQVVAFKRDLSALGFKLIGQVSFADWRAKMPIGFRPFAGIALATDGYDDLEVWRR